MLECVVGSFFFWFSLLLFCLLLFSLWENHTLRKALERERASYSLAKLNARLVLTEWEKQECQRLKDFLGY